MARNEIKYQTWKLQNVTISETKVGLKIYHQASETTFEFSEISHPVQMLKSLLIDNKTKEVEEVLGAVFYAVFGIISDADLLQVVREYFKQKNPDKIQENPEQEEADIEEVKKMQKGKEELNGEEANKKE